MATHRRHLMLGLMILAAATIGAWRTSGTYAAFSDVGSLAGHVAAGQWESPHTVPPECAHLSLTNTPIVGTEGSDIITGTSSNDLIFGLGGDDVIQGANGSDCIVGGSGNDILGGDRQDENGEDVVLGGPGDDVISGGNAKDVLDGGHGNDLIDGRNGNDLAFGGPGSDTLHGSNATDVLDGGTSGAEPDVDVDACDGGRAPDVYSGCEVIDGMSVTT